MATVKFSVPEEFLEELGKELVDRGLVRITHLSRPTKISPNIHHLSIVATAKVAGDILRLERYCGDIWNIGSQDVKVKDEAEAIKRKILEGCAALHLEVRGGVLE